MPSLSHAPREIKEEGKRTRKEIARGIFLGVGIIIDLNAPRNLIVARFSGLNCALNCEPEKGT